MQCEAGCSDIVEAGVMMHGGTPPFSSVDRGAESWTGPEGDGAMQGRSPRNMHKANRKGLLAWTNLSIPVSINPEGVSYSTGQYTGK